MFKLKEHHKADYNRFALNIANPYDEEYNRNCNFLNIAFFKHSYWFIVPQFFKPKEKWVDLTNCDWATEHNGKKGYTDYIRREYGFAYSESTLHIHYGIQPGSWSTGDPENSDHTKVFFIPWLSTRRVRFQIYTPTGELFSKNLDKPDGRLDFEGIEKARDNVPKIKFRFNDFDGEEIEVTCHIEEMEWRKGTGWFKWIGWFTKPTINRTLDLHFNKEIGPEKGSWKGGTIGHSCNIPHGMTPLEALQIYGSGVESYRNSRSGNRGFTNIKEIL